jgi:hypothetical protein
MLKSTSVHVGTATIGCPAGRSPAARCTIYASCCTLIALLNVFFVCPVTAADCLSIQEAAKHIGETKCITGKVLKVKVGNKGVHFLDFCEDQMACPFTVVVFADDLKDVGDVRLFSGRTIEIRGTLKMYDGRPEIILNRISQVEGGAAMIPPLPKNYDVENRGRFSAGRLYPGKKPKKAKPKKPSATATSGNDVERDDPQ